MDNIRRRIRSRCGGLVEIFVVEDTPFVRLMHQTVKEFILRPGFKHYVLGEKYALFAENGYSFLSKYTLAALASSRPCCFRNEGGPTWPRNFCLDAIRYFCLSELTTGMSQREFLKGAKDSIFKDHFAGALGERNEKVRPIIDSVPFPVNSVLSFAVVANLRLYVGEQLQNGSSVNGNPKWSLLHCVVEATIARAYDSLKKGSEEDSDSRSVGSEEGFYPWDYDPPDLSGMAYLFLTHGADKKATFHGMTPFQMLFMKCWEGFWAHERPDITENMIKVAEAFLSPGQNPNVDISVPYPNVGISVPQDLHGNARPQPLVCKPLHVVSASMIKTLLKYGAEVNALDSHCRTPLDVWIGAEGNMFKLGTPETLSEAYETAMLLILNGGRVTKSGKDRLPIFLDLLEEEFAVDPRLRNPPVLGGI